MTTSARLLAALLIVAVFACGETLTDPTYVNEPPAAAKPGSGLPAGIAGQLLGAAGPSFGRAVSGTYAAGASNSQAAVWNAARTAIPLPIPAGTPWSHAYGVSASDIVVGSVGARAVVWHPVGAGSWALPVELPTPDPSWETEAFAVNDVGQIAGRGSGADGAGHALRWTPAGDGYTVEVASADGGQSTGRAIANGTGWVTGTRTRTLNGATVRDGFLWTASGMHFFSGPNGDRVEIRGINSSGVVVGYAVSTSKRGGTTPIKWTCTASACGGPVAVGPLGNIEYAFDVSDEGDIVGTSGLSGVLYDRCGNRTLLTPPANWHQSYGWAISDDGGYAVGYSYPKGGSTVQATRWSLPVPSC
jgi:hypothetical protein